MTRPLLCLAILATAAPRLSAQEIRVVAAGETVTRTPVTRAWGYPALPLTLLAALGAEIAPGTRDVRVELFGDTLRFRTGYPDFVVNGVAVPLHNWTFAMDGALHVPERFFTEWLPARYPDRLRFARATLTLRGAVPAPTMQVARQVADSPRAEPAPPPRIPAPPPRNTAITRRPAPIGREAEEGTMDPEAALPSPLVGFVDSRVSGVYDSNIDHQAVPRSSTGTVVRIAVGIQSAMSRPFMTARYQFGLSRFAESERWNRTTHDVSAALAPSLAPFRFRLEGAVRVGSWTEDRELADQIVLRPSAELRASRAVAITVYGAQRVRQISAESGERADTSRLGGLEVARRWRSGGRWELDARYEENRSERPRNRFTSWSGRTQVRVPLTTAARVTLEASYRERRFDERLVDLGTGGGEVPRRDQRWTPSVVATHDFARGYWVVELAYDLEHNASNEPQAGYLAHRFGLTLRRRW